MGSYGDNEATYSGMKITKVSDGEFGGIALDSNNYEGGIDHIEISHERTRTPNEPSAEEEQTILRSELGKLMWVARAARPGAIYDASAAEQTFSDGEILRFQREVGEF